ncbi:radial spoke head protein 3 homolog [Parambassis ranga]|uniref:Radial spoke head protein 3 homolog n=1 Tax=Parambassis ranga TaxID=210632 RepID=A0A6P7JFS4_9TELE|nr:radial spoke head protein 3 homolog [Parambassis ranga]
MAPTSRMEMNISSQAAHHHKVCVSLSETGRRVVQPHVVLYHHILSDKDMEKGEELDKLGLGKADDAFKATGGLLDPDISLKTAILDGLAEAAVQHKVYTTDGQHSYGDIMYDGHAVRGSVQAQHIPHTSNPARMQRQQGIRNRARDQYRPRTPEHRQHVDAQTDLYLEELSDVIDATEAEAQTDAFLDKPATPLFIPAKSGKDAETQIEDGELFDFDREVQPVLEVLVGKTIEQSLLEVMEEEELACLRAQQRAFQELRNSELAEVQRLQEQERRHSEEKVRNFYIHCAQKKVLEEGKEIAEKIAARAYTQTLLADLLPRVFTSLRTHGYFHDPVEKDIETNFLPWLMDEVHNRVEKRFTARQLLDTIIYK